MILLKTVSREYYRQNIGFYLFILLFGFGFLSRTEHVTLARLSMGNPYILIWPVLAWIIHVLKTTFFFHKTIQLPEYGLLQDFTLKSKFQQFKELTLLQFNLNAPFLAYAAFMAVIGFMEGTYVSVVLLVLVNLVLLIIPVIASYYRLLRFHFTLSFDTLATSWSFFPNWPSLYFLRHLFKNKPLLFFSTKLYSMFFLIGGAELFATDDYDVRLLFICSLLAAAGLFPTGKEFSEFTSANMLFEKNIPFSMAKIFSNRALTAFWLVFLEMCILTYHWIDKVAFIEILGVCTFIWSVMLFWIVFSHSNLIWNDKNIQRVYYLGIFLFILIMFKLPIILFSAGILALTWWIFKRNYFTFEVQPSETS